MSETPSGAALKLSKNQSNTISPPQGEQTGYSSSRKKQVRFDLCFEDPKSDTLAMGTNKRRARGHQRSEHDQFDQEPPNKRPRLDNMSSQILAPASPTQKPKADHDESNPEEPTPLALDNEEPPVKRRRLRKGLRTHHPDVDEESHGLKADSDWPQDLKQGYIHAKTLEASHIETHDQIHWNETAQKIQAQRKEAQNPCSGSIFPGHSTFLQKQMESPENTTQGPQHTLLEASIPKECLQDEIRIDPLQDGQDHGVDLGQASAHEDQSHANSPQKADLQDNCAQYSRGPEKPLINQDSTASFRDMKTAIRCASKIARKKSTKSRRSPSPAQQKLPKHPILLSEVPDSGSRLGSNQKKRKLDKNDPQTWQFDEDLEIPGFIHQSEVWECMTRCSNRLIDELKYNSREVMSTLIAQNKALRNEIEVLRQRIDYNGQ